MPLNKNDLIALIDNLFADNTSNDITPSKLRQGLTEMISSDLNMEELTDQYLLGALTGLLLKTQAAQVDPAWQEGLVFWDDVEKALSYYNEESDTKINCGQEVVIKVYNNNGATIMNGDAVRFDTSVGGIPTVVRSLADTLANSASSGIATHDIPVGETGYVTRTGKVSDVDTSMWSEGDILYISDTVPGGLTNVPPGIVSPIAIVLTSDVSGQIFTATSRTQTPVALGQERSPLAPTPSVTQSVTTTPQPFEGYDNSPFAINTTVTNIASGNGYRAQFSPESNAFSGFYKLSGTAAITSSANVAVFLEVYLNGSPTGLISAVDLTNPNIDFGTAALASFTESQLTPSDVIEAYIYCDTGTTTVTWNSLSFAIERLGVS